MTEAIQGRRGAIERPTNELRFQTCEAADDYGLSRTVRILQQKWLVQVDMDAPTSEWRDVPEVGA